MKTRRVFIRKTEYAKRKKRGFTVVETVVSMALVAILSVAALATVQTSLNALQKNDVRRDVLRESENVITCYQSDNFSSALKLLYGLEGFDEADPITLITLYFNSDCVASTESDGALWSMEVTVSTDEGGNYEKLSLVARYLRSGDTIYSTDYTRYKKGE